MYQMPLLVMIFIIVMEYILTTFLLEQQPILTLDERQTQLILIKLEPKILLIAFLIIQVVHQQQRLIRLLPLH